MAGAPPTAGPFTFAIIGRDEAATLPRVIAEAQRAAEPGDRVWFVDSASRDDSAAIASRLGVEVVEAPAGKGRAVAAALERCQRGYVCLIDADLVHWTKNVPATLRAATVASGADMVVGIQTNDRRRSITPFLYWPLVDALFPDYGRQCDPRPLSGLRVVDASIPIGPLPGGYGVETYLNLAFGAAGRRVAVTDLGLVLDPLRDYSNLLEVACAVAQTILDFAAGQGMLDPAARPAWEGWVGGVLEVMAGVPPPGADDGEFNAKLSEAVSRTLPPALQATPG